jgi:hypothetical protein
MRLLEAIGAATVVAALVVVISWRVGADLVAVPAALALLTFLTVMLSPRGAGRSLSRRPAPRRRTRVGR